MGARSLSHQHSAFSAFLCHAILPHLPFLSLFTSLLPRMEWRGIPERALFKQQMSHFYRLTDFCISTSVPVEGRLYLFNLSHFFSMMLSQSHSAGSEVPCIPEQAVESEIGLILGKQASSFLCSFYDFFFVHAFASDMLARNRTPLILVPCNAFLSNKNLHDKSYHKGFLKTKL